MGSEIAEDPAEVRLLDRGHLGLLDHLLEQLRLTPALEAGASGAGARLRRSIRLEALAVLAILATTATLTTVASPERPEQGTAMAIETPAALPARLPNHG